MRQMTRNYCPELVVKADGKTMFYANSESIVRAIT